MRIVLILLLSQPGCGLRYFGPLTSPATHLRALRESARSFLAPHSESCFAWHAEHSPGELLFSQDSEHSGNGKVTVVQHGPWRCLRFDDVEQGLAYSGRFARGPVLGEQYLRVMAAAGAASAEWSWPREWQAGRMLCVGLGTGALPAFLAARFPELDVEVVEVDSAVVRASRQVLGGRFQV